MRDRAPTPIFCVRTSIQNTLTIYRKPGGDPLVLVSTEFQKGHHYILCPTFCIFGKIQIVHFKRPPFPNMSRDRGLSSGSDDGGVDMIFSDDRDGASSRGGSSSRLDSRYSLDSHNGREYSGGDGNDKGDPPRREYRGSGLDGRPASRSDGGALYGRRPENNSRARSNLDRGGSSHQRIGACRARRLARSRGGSRESGIMRGANRGESAGATAKYSLCSTRPNAKSTTQAPDTKAPPLPA